VDEEGTEEFRAGKMMGGFSQQSSISDCSDGLLHRIGFWLPWSLHSVQGW
jgi:hypothetical protein